MYEVMMKTIYSKIDVYLIRNQHKQFVLTNPRINDDSSDWEPDYIPRNEGRHVRMTLTDGLYPNHSEETYETFCKEKEGEKSDPSTAVSKFEQF